MKNLLFLCALLAQIPLFAQAENWEWAIEPQFEWAEDFSEGLAAAEQNGKRGFIDKTGKWAIQPQFDELSFSSFYYSTTDFSEGLAAVKQNRKWGFIDKTGKWIIQPQFEWAGNFSEGLCCARQQNDKNGFIDKTGKWVIQPQFENVRTFSEGLAAVCQNYKWGFIDKTGKWVIQPQFDYIVNSFRSGLVSVRQNDMWGFIDKTGKWVIQPHYRVVSEFSEGLATVKQTHDKCGFIDKTGEWVIQPQFDGAGLYSESLAAAKQTEYSKCGYIDKTGKWIIQPQFEWVGNFSEGLARAQQNGKFGYIRYTPNKPSAEKPRIQWDAPYTTFTNSSSPNYTIKACIQSNSPVSQVLVYVNGTLQSQRGFSVEDNCKANVNMSISLTSGQNTVYIEAGNVSGTTQSEQRIIKYQGTAPQPSSGNYHALLIGVNDYSDYSISDLAKPISDVQPMQNILTQQYTFNSSDVHLLKNPTKEQIVNKITELQNRLQEKDHLLIFYAGHGVEQNNMGYWLPANATKSSVYNWLSYDELVGYIKGMKSKHVLVVADACYSGAMVLRDATMQEKTCELLDQTKSRRIITSGAKQVVPDDSVFLKYFIQALNNNKYACMTAHQVFNELNSPVIYNSPNGQLPQNSVIPNTGAEGGDFIFKRK